jgi:malonate-semialdehyde dehydrogenase (acetylating)/methylmalonate-semialdehyde dehydrogenase
MTATAEDQLVQNYVNGRWENPDTSAFLPLEDPATRETLGRVPLSAPPDVDRAVQAAATAFPAWRETPPVERARVLFRLKMLLEEHLDTLAESLSREHGKGVAECRGEIRRGIENVEHACGIPSLMMGETLEDVAPGIDCETVRQPLGVFGVITPYNFPVMIPLWFWPYAVACGNTVVLKPSEQDPLTHQRIVDLATQAGLPAGALNVVHGDRGASEALIRHPEVKGISLVGSSATAESVYRAAAATGKRVQALGGAKNHMIVMPDADYDYCTDAVVSSVFGSTGQRCLAGSVVLGVGDAYGEMKQRVVDGASALRMGRGIDADTDMGPVISAAHAERVKNFVSAGQSEGATVLLDGRHATVEAYPDGHWIGPTVFDNVEPRMSIGTEEIFGPVVGFNRVDSLDDALELVHENRYGNAISLFTTSGKTAREFRYHAGISMIGINIGVVAPMAFFPFGGSRGSFYGDLKAQGKDAIEFFTDKRVVISRW